MAVRESVFTNRTARLRKEQTSEANQHRTTVHDYDKLHTETETKQKQKLTKRQESGGMDRGQQRRVRERGRGLVRF
jgi:hypothetical protein